MKLRQKLAVVLATAMVATAVPVVTFAASDNGMLREVLKVKKDTEFMERSTAGGIEIKLKDAWQGNKEVFYMTLTNAEWNDNTRTAMVKALSADGTAVTRLDGTVDTTAQKNKAYPIYADKIFKNNSSTNVLAGEIIFSGDKEAKVIIYDDDTIKANGESTTFEKLEETLRVPLLVKATGGDATVKLEKSGSTSTITDANWVFATTAEKKLTFTADDPEVVYETGKLAAVTFAENYSGAFADGDKAYIEYEMQDGDYKFDFASKSSPVASNVSIPNSNDNDDDDYTKYQLSPDFFELSYGFIGGSFEVNAYVNNDDKGICVFEIINKSGRASDSIGKLKLKDIPVRNDEDDIQEGDLLVDITNYEYAKNDDYKLLDNATDDVKLGKIVAYSTSIEMKDSKPVDIVAGRVEEIEFTLKENIDDSMVGDREIEIALADDLAHFDYAKGTTLYTYSINNGSVSTPQDDKGTDSILDDQSEYEWTDAHSGKEKLVQSIKVDDDNNSILVVKLNPKAQINGEKDKIKIKIKVCVPVSYKDKETVTLKATGRGIEENKEGVTTTAINIKNPFDVTSEEMRVKVGLQNQVGGHVTIKETDKEMFMKGKMYLKVVDPSTGQTVDGIKFYTDKDNYVTYEATGDIKKADLDSVVENGTATIKLNRQSKSASTLDLKDFHVTVDRTVPEGKYDLVLTGDAISEHYYETANANTKDAAVTSTSQVAQYDYVANSNGSYADVKDANGNVIKSKVVKADYTLATGETWGTTYAREYVGTKTVTTTSNGKQYLYADDAQARAHQIVVKDFFVVGTPNTEDLAANGLARGTATFVIGESKYTANGQEYTMDAASYIQDGGYTMVPVRYVAQAFGVTTNNVIFANGSVTILAGERTIQLTNGSDVAYLNGAQYKLATKVAIKDGRTYAPIGEVANMLGIKKTWDNTTKTATFINE